MNETLEISHFCIIKDNYVVLDGNTVFSRQGDFREFSDAAYRHINVGYPKFHKMDGLCKLGFLTTELLLSQRNVTRHYQSDRISMVLTNSSSSLDTDRKYQQSISSKDNYFPSPSVFVYTLPNVVIGEICIRHKILGEGCFLVMEKFDPEFLAAYAGQIIGDSIADCCIAGWVEVNGDEYESGFFLIEKTGIVESGIAKFSPANIRSIFYQE